MSKRSRRKQALVVRQKAQPPNGLSSVDGQGENGWFTIFDGTGGWFQRDYHPINPLRIQRNWVVFSCQTLIAGDMGKMRPMLVERQQDTWQEVESPAFSPVLRKPNGFQIWPKFVQYWILSKVSRGNAYILKQRDGRRVVTALYVLDPDRVTPLVAPDGSVYYRLSEDDLAQVPDGEVVVPASEIMHDRMWCLFHPLVGLSPLFASALSAGQGLAVLEQSKRFFENSSRPGGILVAPVAISDDLARAYKKRWEENYAGGNEGRTAVLGNGLKYEPLAQNAVDSELVAQLKLSAEMICSTYHVPAYMVGVGPIPTYANAEVLDQIYYKQCLQVLIQDAEELVDDGLELGRSGYHFQFDLDDLMRMDTALQIDTLNKSVGGGWMAPDEARAKRNMLPVPGGSSPMMQQQQFSLEALAERDRDKPFAKPTPAPVAPTPDPEAEAAADETIKAAANVLRLNRFRDQLRRAA